MLFPFERAGGPASSERAYPAATIG